eukprot:Tbor_TRINITY_DN1884_c0_g1::TRINITY_DN1884_c0_g1_i1::g.23048::m.23048
MYSMSVNRYILPYANLFRTLASTYHSICSIPTVPVNIRYYTSNDNIFSDSVDDYSNLQGFSIPCFGWINEGLHDRLVEREQLIIPELASFPSSNFRRLMSKLGHIGNNTPRIRVFLPSLTSLSDKCEGDSYIDLSVIGWTFPPTTNKGTDEDTHNAVKVDDNKRDAVLVVHSEGWPAALCISEEELSLVVHRSGPCQSVQGLMKLDSQMISASLASAIRHLPEGMKGDVDVYPTKARTSYDNGVSCLINMIGAIITAAEELVCQSKGLEKCLTATNIVSRQRRQLSFDYPYHCVLSSRSSNDSKLHQAEKVLLDTHPDIVSLFFSGRNVVEHGDKLLTPYGSGVLLGIGEVESRKGCSKLLQPFWHPTGSPAGMRWATPHGLNVRCNDHSTTDNINGGMGMILLGKSAPLTLNGPLSTDFHLTEVEDLSRYLVLKEVNANGDTFKVDNSMWLSRGLFGVEPGGVYINRQGREFEILGVGRHPYRPESSLELFLKTTDTNKVLPRCLSESIVWC